MSRRFHRAVLALALAAPLAGAAAAQAPKPRVLVYYDMEGISGISRPAQVFFARPADYQPAREFLTGDVNAAIRGLVAGGAGEIVVTDAHGSGNPDPDILLDKLDPRATFAWRDTPFDPYSDLPDSSFQAIVCIGMHARANTAGFMAHTFTVEPSFRLNGTDINETEIIANFAAPFRLPVIMVSGDDVLQREIAERFPQAEYAVVKHALSRARAEVLPEAEAWKNIEAAARRAIGRLAEIRPLAPAREFRWEIGWQNARQADLVVQGRPAIRRLSPTVVAYDTPTMRAGYDEAKALSSLAGAERASMLVQVIRKRPDGDRIMADYLDALVERWVNPPAPAPEAPAPAGRGRRYHGDS